jgi:methyltransferase (TIGR00027 family)
MDQKILLEENQRGISYTAFYTCARRAEESMRSDALIQDKYAAKLAGRAGQKFLEIADDKLSKDSMHVNNPALLRFMGYRTYILDSLLLKTIKENNITQIVNLACGLDTRPYRLNLDSHIKFYELDYNAVIYYKRQVLENEKARPTCELHSLGVDLTEGTQWVEKLKGNGFDSNKPCVFITEGLLYYLNDRDDIPALLNRISALSAKGSYIIGDMFSSSMMEASPTKIMVAILNSTYQTEFKSCSDSFAKVLEGYGWEGKNLLISPNRPEKYEERESLDIPAKYLFYGIKSI